MTIPLVVTKTWYEGQRVTSWGQPATQTNSSGSKSRQNLCQARPTEYIENLSASRRCLRVRTAVSTVVSGVLPGFQNLDCCTSYREDCLMCCPPRPSNKQGHNSDSKSFLAIGGLHEDKLCDTLQARATTNNVKNHSSSLLTTPYREQPRSTWIVVVYPRPAFSTTKRTNHAPISFDNKPKFLKATFYTGLRKIEIPKSMVVEALSWRSWRAS